jgi:hypothetical protein
VDTRLADLNAADGVSIGSGLAASLVSNRDANAAVAEWITKYPALQEFDEGHAWFRPLMDTVGKRLLAKSKLGARFRLYSGAGLSFMDMVTDMNMIVKYLGTPGKEGFGYALLTMVGLCMLLQLLLIWSQNRKGPKKEMAKEVLFALSALKAGVDAYRVASGNEWPAHKVNPPDVELTVTKLSELTFEAIPGCIMQFYVLIKVLQDGEAVNKQAILSLVMSALSAGFSSATITYESERSSAIRCCRYRRCCCYPSLLGAAPLTLVRARFARAGMTTILT